MKLEARRRYGQSMVHLAEVHTDRALCGQRLDAAPVIEHGVSSNALCHACDVRATLNGSNVPTLVDEAVSHSESEEGFVF